MTKSTLFDTKEARKRTHRMKHSTKYANALLHNKLKYINWHRVAYSATAVQL